MNNHTLLYLYVNKYKIMNRNLRMIKKMYVEPLIRNIHVYFNWFFK